MEISQIRYFSAVVETGHLRKAALLLGLSPGALSKSMALLQEELENRLFISSGRGLEITDQGRKFYLHAQRVLSEYALLSKSMVEASITDPPIRISSLELFTTYFMGNLIKNDFHGDSLVVLERVPGKIEESVLNRETDIGITYAPIPHEKLDFLKICSFEKKIFARRGAFQQMPFEKIPFSAPITPISGSPTGITSLDGWPSDVPRTVKYHFELLETALQAARLGLCAIFCPDFVVPLQNQMANDGAQLVALNSPRGMPAVKRNVFIVKRRTDPESIAIKKIAKNLRKTCLGKL